MSSLPTYLAEGRHAAARHAARVDDGRLAGVAPREVRRVRAVPVGAVPRRARRTRTHRVVGSHSAGTGDAVTGFHRAGEKKRSTRRREKEEEAYAQDDGAKRRSTRSGATAQQKAARAAHTHAARTEAGGRPRRSAAWAPPASRSPAPRRSAASTRRSRSYSPESTTDTLHRSTWVRAGSFRGCCVRAARTLSRAHAPRPAQSPNPQTGRLSRASLSARSSLGHACARVAVEQRSNRSDPGAVRAFTRLKKSALVLEWARGPQAPTLQFRRASVQFIAYGSRT